MGTIGRSARRRIRRLEFFHGFSTGRPRLSEKCPTPVRRVGVQDKFGCSGPAWDLLKLYGLDAATICKTAKEMLGK